MKPSELEIAGLLELNRTVTDRLEAVREADAEEIREEIIEALRGQLLEINQALTHLGPYTEAPATKKRRARQRAQAAPSVDEGHASTG